MKRDHPEVGCNTHAPGYCKHSLCARKNHQNQTYGDSNPLCYSLTQKLAKLAAIPLGEIVLNVNRSLRGWANYFHYRKLKLDNEQSQEPCGMPVANALDEAS